MANERVTEDLVDDLLREVGYYDEYDKVIVEKQQSAIQSIRSALSKASKTGKGGVGYPEFIITSPSTPDMVVVVECKASVTKHQSKDRDKPADFAVDGVLHYARHLSGTYTVIAIAVSGTKRSNRWSFFLIPKGETEPRELVAPQGAAVDHLIPMDDLIRAASFDASVVKPNTVLARNA
jgi:type I restriction enzyme M protein